MWCVPPLRPGFGAGAAAGPHLPLFSPPPRWCRLLRRLPLKRWGFLRLRPEPIDFTVLPGLRLASPLTCPPGAPALWGPADAAESSCPHSTFLPSSPHSSVRSAVSVSVTASSVSQSPVASLSELRTLVVSTVWQALSCVRGPREDSSCPRHPRHSRWQTDTWPRDAGKRSARVGSEAASGVPESAEMSLSHEKGLRADREGRRG